MLADLTSSPSIVHSAIVVEFFQYFLINMLFQFQGIQGIKMVSNWMFATSIVATLCSFGRLWALENLPILLLVTGRPDPDSDKGFFLNPTSFD
jgi:hypothetical protein